jgi:hypothetical protein
MLISGTSTDAVDLTPFVAQCQQTSTELDLTIRWHEEFPASIANSGPCGSYTTLMPSTGQWIEVVFNGGILWRGMVYSIAQYIEERGTRQMRISARTRDQCNAWRGVERVTNVYPMGTIFDGIAADICSAVIMAPQEYLLNNIGLSVYQQNLQFAAMSAWDMLTNLLWPAMLTPWTNGKGLITYYSRNLDRPSSKTYSKDRIISFNQGRQLMPITNFKLSWLDPNLTKVVQIVQKLGEASITAGYFQLHQNKDIWFQAGGSAPFQRAENTYLVVKQSANSGLVHFCSEDYAQDDDWHGTIKVTTSAWEPTLLTVLFVGYFASHFIPDDVVTGGLFVEGGVTIPVGRLVEGADILGILLTMSCVGTGHYEVWGEPWDYLHRVNITEAIDNGAPPWNFNRSEVRCDLISGEPMADQISVNELKFQAYSSQKSTITMVDDLNIEVGDIITTYDGATWYVLDYLRDLSRGAQPTVQLTVFLIPSPGSS